jgi:hypothetical protein
MRLWITCIAFAVSIVSAQAYEPARLVPKSQWIVGPSDADYARVLSPAALAAKSDGLATLQCTATEAGALTTCAVVSEYPTDLGLGSSALQLVPLIRVGPGADKGSVAGRVRVPVYFRIVPGSPDVIQNPDWAALPTSDELLKWAALSPNQQRTHGGAALNCAVDVDGHLFDCQVVREDPLGQGYGAAALRVATHLRMFPKTRAAEPVRGARVALPFRF